MLDYQVMLFHSIAWLQYDAVLDYDATLCYAIYIRVLCSSIILKNYILHYDAMMLRYDML